MKPVRTLIVLSATLMALSLCLAAPRAHAYSISGYVFGSNSQAAPGIRVIAANARTHLAVETFTDARGLYVIRDLSAGTYLAFAADANLRDTLQPTFSQNPYNGTRGIALPTAAAGGNADNITFRAIGNDLLAPRVVIGSPANGATVTRPPGLWSGTVSDTPAGVGAVAFVYTALGRLDTPEATTPSHYYNWTNYSFENTSVDVKLSPYSLQDYPYYRLAQVSGGTWSLPGVDKVGNLLPSREQLPYLAGGTYLLRVCAVDAAGNFKSVAARFTLPGSILFSSDAYDGNREIYTVQPDGKNRRRLTSDPAVDQTPIFNANGSHIAFSSNRSGVFKLFIMAANGANVRQLTAGPGNDRYPSFSPDGRFLVFASDRDAPATTASQAGSERTSKFKAEQWRVEPRRHETEFGQKPEDIYLLNLQNGETTRLTTEPSGDTSPRFRPSGGKIVFVSERGPESGLNADEDIYIMDSTGANQIQLTNDRALDLVPAWNSTGTKIVFDINAAFDDDTSGIAVINSDGSDFTLITPGNASSVAFSPDNTRVVVSARGISIVNIDRSGGTLLVDEQGFVVSGEATDWR